MDIFCPRCGEACGIDELHEYVGEWVTTDIQIASFKHAKDIFFSRGCGFLMNGGRLCDKATDKTLKHRATVSSALHDLLGDDVDGIASELDDAEYFGIL